MTEQDKIEYLARSIEQLIDVKTEKSSWPLVEDARADIKEALALLFNVELY